MAGCQSSYSGIVEHMIVIGSRRRSSEVGLARIDGWQRIVRVVWLVRW